MSEYALGLGTFLATIAILVLTFVLVIVAIVPPIRAWLKGKPSPDGTATGRWPQLAFDFIAAVLLVLIAWRTWDIPQAPLGLNSGWPDAIKYQSTMPENTGPSPLIFYSQGITTARSPFGDVVRYFLVGGRNITDPIRFPLPSKDQGFPPHVGYPTH